METPTERLRETAPNSVAGRKLDRLEQLLAPLRSVVLGFSGGVDSTFLLAVLCRDPGRSVLALTAVSPTYPAWQTEEARQLARDFRVEHLELVTDELQQDSFRRNPPDRCYHCKKHLFSRMEAIRKERGFDALLDGSNRDDLADYRPGKKALVELGVRSPLMEADLTKAEIRALSRQMGLPTWNKPAFACLSSRFPYGTEITENGLDRVDRCESFLLRKVQGPLRVRAHGRLARIEVPEESLAGVLADRAELVAYFKEQGFAYVSLDLQGYRTGSMNEVLPEKEKV